VRHPRRLPAEARFVTVEELFAMPEPEREETFVLLGPLMEGESGGFLGRYGWMNVSSLLAHPAPYGQASLVSAPSTLMLVVSTDPPARGPWGR
jgi:hypothetical protein